MTITEGLAIYGAVLSTIIVILRIIEKTRDRYIIKASVYFNSHPVYHPSPGTHPVRIVIVRRGSEKIVIRRLIGIRGRFKKRRLLFDIFELHTEEGEEHSFYVLKENWDKVLVPALRYLRVADSSHREWPVYKQSVKNAIAECQTTLRDLARNASDIKNNE